MEKRKQYLVKNLPLMSLRDWLNEQIALDEGKNLPWEMSRVIFVEERFRKNLGTGEC